MRYRCALSGCRLGALLSGKSAAHAPVSFSSCGLFSVFLRPGKQKVIAKGKRGDLESWSADFRVPSLLGRCCGWSAMHREPCREKVTVSPTDSHACYSLVYRGAITDYRFHSPRGDKAMGVLEMWCGGLCATMKGRRDSPLGHCSVEEESPAFSGLRLRSWRGDALGDDQGNERAPGPGPHQHLPLRRFPEAWVGKHEHIQQRQQTGLRLRKGWSLGKGILPF